MGRALDEKSWNSIFALVNMAWVQILWVKSGPWGKVYVFYFIIECQDVLVAKYIMEACPQMSYDLVFQSKQGPIFSYHISKIPKIGQKTDIWFLKFKFQSGVKQKTYIFGSFLRHTAPLQSNPPQKCINIFADSKPCITYKVFGTWVRRWSKWNAGVTIFSHFFTTMGW